ncbi:hypothetical protein QBC36DRAFT_86153 [Triangularia setosa]|uniref:Azaphilone pigments biosynthesis cluster protein L N-terminal domain-containing protein n=1 Tax=Triangularia setosa TaxID=2587417 RepID=A0AAN6WCQ8_9PEZI|nr:hypothetical protein QBC36DRAFT_86153 [Podospora setosa]
MADSLSAIASILTLTEAACVGVKSLQTFVDGLRNAPSRVQTLTKDLDATHKILKELEDLLKEEKEAGPTLVPFLDRFDIKSVTEATNQVVDEFKSTIEKCTARSTAAQEFSARDRLTVTLQQSRIGRFKTRLNASRSTIQYTVQIGFSPN